MAIKNNKRIIIISAAVVVLVIAAVIVWLLYFRTQPAEEMSPTVVDTGTEVVTVNASTNTIPTTPPTVEPVDLTLKRLSELFAERYGSFSSDSNFQNVTELKPYMTDKMKIAADNYVDSEQGNSSPDFKSIVTKVLSTNIGSTSGGEVEVRLSTQRIESGDTFADNDVYYQDIVLELVQDGDQWLIDSATWQAKGITAPATPSTADTTSTNSLDILELLQELE